MMIYEVRYRLKGDPGPFVPLQKRAIGPDKDGLEKFKDMLNESKNPYEYRLYSLFIPDDDWTPVVAADGTA